jgi:hypothetical protein
VQGIGAEIPEALRINAGTLVIPAAILAVLGSNFTFRKFSIKKRHGTENAIGPVL